MLREAEKQFLSALKSADMVTTVLELSKVAHLHSFDANIKAVPHNHSYYLSKARCEYIADVVMQAMQCLCSACVGGMPVCYCLMACSAICLDAPVCKYVGCCPATAQLGRHQQLATAAEVY